MTILVLSADEDAATALCSALARSGCTPRWETEPDSARDVARREPPAVLVADTAVVGHDRLVDEVRTGTPWARVYLLGDAPESDGLFVVNKPFDASGLADVLLRERELARLDRGNRTLQAEAEELGLLLEASFEAIIALAADGTIRSWNLGAATIYGYRAEEVIGRHIGMLDADGCDAEQRLSGPARSVREVARRRKDGTELLALVSLSRVERPGNEQSYAEVSLDVTDRRKLERELEHAERLAAIGRIAAGMAHEINNPLAVIHASVAYIAEISERISDPELEECLRDTRLAVERIGTFVQHVVGFARRERPRVADAPLSEAVDIAFRMVRPRAKDRGVTVHVEDVGAVRTPHDPTRLAQALLNVLSNAVDAAAVGGREVFVRVLPARDGVSVQIDDTGPGIAPAIAARMFEPFATTKPYGQGTGLGLAITKQIVDDHGGRIELKPISTGTRVEISLPGLRTSEHRVLVVEEDPAVRRALSADLLREGFVVARAGSLAAARDDLAERPASVVVVDVRLPDARAAGVVPALRAAAPRARIVVVSGPAEEVAAGDADLVLSKPWDRADLVAAVRGLCA